jgi:predicted ATP-dependent serine protease
MTSLSASKSAKAAKVSYVCTDCGSAQSKWMGQCGDCGAWNTLQEFVEKPAVSARLSAHSAGYAGASEAVVRKLSEVPSMEVDWRARSSFRWRFGRRKCDSVGRRPGDW